ncbi:alcohol dehydrogenase catalytic domain-containing protein [Desulforamulus aquiferis]|uniref:Alcohol dehydrogenase catalytic domain-containing protein n=2 Tax=Desulforamulus aquiferis TaxID=1397668 RepID=A0AAW7ZDY3_9FIRM|nr:alcohol dehydrogenase catalytic domain-containing protein [Desulforamulus aquiferis]RYD01422.1 hypothetical protein N752_30985 [Desulforamulus aquiferis]
MRQALTVRPFEFEIIESAAPALQEGCAIIKVVYCGVCGSDLHVYEGKHPKVKPPAVLGHEAVGIITQIGNNKDNLQVGDKVAVVPLIGCKECEYCKLGYPNQCVNRKVVGFQVTGCLAEEVSIPIENLIKLPEGCDLLEASLLEPLAVVVHCVGLLERIKISTKEAIVTGAGTIGILIGLYLREKLGMNVSMVEINANRKELAEKIGFKVFQGIKDIPIKDTRPVAFECTGNKKVLDMLVTTDPAPEVIVILGTFERTLELNIFEMCKRESYIIGSQMYTKKDLEIAAQIMSTPMKEVFKSILVERIYSLSEAKEAYDEALNSQKGTKVIIQVNK